MIATAWIASPFLYHVLYGERFASAATPFVILTAAKAFVLVGGPFAWGLWTNGRDLTMLTIMGVSALASTCISVLLIPRFGMPAAAFANLAGEMIIALGCIAFSLVNKRAGNLPS
jgi:O-antigen/teichoic acid export membrane protein